MSTWNYTSQSRAQDVVSAFIPDQGFWSVVSSVPSAAGDALPTLNPLSPNLAEGTPSGSNYFWDIAGVNYYITGSAWTAITQSAGNYSFPSS